MQKTLLVAAPWANYESPSLPACHLASYARRTGHAVDVCHLYLELAAEIGLALYDQAVEGDPLGEEIAASLLFPKVFKAKKNVPRRFDRLRAATEKALKAVYRKTDWGRYGLVGFSVNYQQLFPSLLVANWIKRDFPKMKILLGGRLVAGGIGESILRCFEFIDWCVDGEGEIPLTRLIDRLSAGSRVDDVPGIVYRHGDQIKRNARAALDDISGSPVPDYDFYFETIETHKELKHHNLLPDIAVIESYGCKYSCAFCSDKSFWGRYRPRSASAIADEIRTAVERYNLTSFIFISQMVREQRCRELFRTLADLNFDACLICETRADISKEALMAMKDAGVTEVQIGLEALDTRLLAKMSKGTRLIDNLKAMKFCEELGLAVTSNMLLGFPTESQADIDRTVKAIDYAATFMPPSRFVDFELRQGCPVADDPASYGIDSIRNTHRITRHLPPEVSRRIEIWQKEFRSTSRPRDYRALKTRIKRWRKAYDYARVIGRPLLFYLDCPPLLDIEDTRTGLDSLFLRGWNRELYLFCDEIRSFDEIKKKFRTIPEKELRRTLKKLFRLKVMYTEDDDWLSLAIRASSQNRRNMPFI